MSNEHKQWLKRLMAFEIPDDLWPIGMRPDGTLNEFKEGEKPPEPIVIRRDAEASKQ